MNWRNIGVYLLVWALMLCHAAALSIIPWTDATYIEEMDRIVVGTVEVKDEQSIITVEKVLKGAAEPKIITTKRKPGHGDLHDNEKTNKVLWMEANPGRYKNDASIPFFYIKEDSPRWLLYHGLIDPAPLVRDKVFERNSDALHVLGYLFDALKVTSSEAPMVAVRMMRVKSISNSLPWTHQGVLDLECHLNPEAPDYRRVDYMSAQDESAVSIKHLIERLYFGHEESPVPSSFSLRIDARKIESVGSLSYEEAAGHLRRHIRMKLVHSPGSDRRVRDHDRYALDQVIRVSLYSLIRMRDADSVPDVLLLAAESDDNLSSAVFDFLESARDPRSVELMCKLLAENAPKHPEKYWLSGGAAGVLGVIGDPAAVPYLEEGVRHGVQSAYFPLAQIGRVESMGTIIQSDKGGGFEAWANAPLYWLVKRSNLETEPWMEPRQQNDGSRNDKLRAKWRKWWLAHKNEMKLVRTYEEANRGWEPQWRKDERSGKAYAMKHGWKYGLGAGVILALWFVYRSRRVPKSLASM